jgi:hypothetical protein
MILPPKQRQQRQPFAKEALQRLPLAEAFYLIWRYIADDKTLNQLFEQYRGRCYEDKLIFSELVMVLADAVTRFGGCGRGAILDALKREELSSKMRTVYLKLNRLPLPLAEAFLSTMTTRLRELLPIDMVNTLLPSSFASMTVVVIDGKKIKKVAKRILCLRDLAGKVFGGKILAAYLPALGMTVAMAADPNGNANDIRLMPRIVPLAT